MSDKKPDRILVQLQEVLISKSKKLEDIKTALDNFHAVVKILGDDVKEAGELCRNGLNSFRLRTYIRTFFALVEGTSFVIKQLALTMHEHEPCFSEEEVSLLRELTYELDDRGNVRRRPRYLGTADNIKFIVKSLTKAFDRQSNTSFDGEGWERFKELIDLRNRITHPKDATSLKILESDTIIIDQQMELGERTDILLRGADWYRLTLVEIASSIEYAIAKYMLPLKESAAKLEAEIERMRAKLPEP